MADIITLAIKVLIARAITITKSVLRIKMVMIAINLIFNDQYG